MFSQACNIIRRQVVAPSPALLRRAPAAVRMASTIRPTITELIKHDHKELEDYYHRIVNSKDYDEQTRYQNQFIWELARHSIGEEIVVYPKMEAVLQDGAELADKDRAEHQKVKEQLYEFQKLNPGDPDFLPRLSDLWKDLKEHIQEEEKFDLVALENAIATEDSQSLAQSFRRTKKFVPTHSHPNAPDKPPFETVVGLLTAPLDKLVDAFKRFPRD